MSRPPRINYSDATYHVTSRGNGRAKIFLDDDDPSRFIRRLCDNLDTHSVVLYAYVLMENHFHLLARTPRANLSQFMQRLSTSYALYARYLALPTVTVDVETVDAYVSRHYRIEPEDLYEHGHRAGAAKFVAVELACRLTGKTGRAVGAHYGQISSAAVSIIRRNIREGKYDVGPVVKRLQKKICRDEATMRLT